MVNTQTVKIGPVSALVHYFEDYDEFRAEAKPIIDMYEQVCERLLRMGKAGIVEDRYRVEAAIWQAAAITLQVLLDVYLVEEPGEKITLNDIKSFAQDAGITFAKKEK